MNQTTSKILWKMTTWSRKKTRKNIYRKRTVIYQVLRRRDLGSRQRLALLVKFVRVVLSAVGSSLLFFFFYESHRCDCSFLFPGETEDIQNDDGEVLCGRYCNINFARTEELSPRLRGLWMGIFGTWTRNKDNQENYGRSALPLLGEGIFHVTDDLPKYCIFALHRRNRLPTSHQFPEKNVTFLT